MFNKKFLIAACIVGGNLAFSGARADADDAAARCKTLSTEDFSGIVDAPAQVTAVKLEPASAEMPEYCRVSGYVAPSVGFGLLLPAAWNGKFMQIGCGGHCGADLDGPFAAACNMPLQRGYACLLSDMGHKGTGIDGLWAHNNLQAKIDWGFRATHVAAVAGKAITARYYTKPSTKAYFMGCSTGGRQALQAAQRFPWDFDGIVAGAPVIDLSLLYMHFAWGQRAIHDGGGKALLNREHFQLLTEAAVARCDLDDGVKDGIIGDPLRCSFDPAMLACKSDAADCLTSVQIEAARRIYAGFPAMQNGSLRPIAPLPGSEASSWEFYFGVDNDFPVVEKLTLNGFRYLFFWPEPGEAWTLSDLDFERDYKRMGLMQALVDSGNPDLRRFKAAGGKLLVYQGMNDGGLPRPTIDYYETVERTMGGRRSTQDFMRLFLLPGMNHCSGGSGADAVDFLSHLEAWVEKGQPPNRILSGHLKNPAEGGRYPYRQLPTDPAALSFTRPVYPYPMRVKYLGRGDSNDAANYGPVQP